MTPRERLKSLMSQEHKGLRPWLIGFIPEHYKRLTVDRGKLLELAMLGFQKIGAAYSEKLYFSQSVIAGAIFSGEFDNIVVVTPSVYGKSWLLGHIVPLLAARGENWYVSGSTGDKTDIIMNYTIRSLQDIDPEIQMLLDGVDKTKLDKLASTLSKSKISFGRSTTGDKGGSIEAVSLGDTYAGLAGNKAIGKPGNYIVDEAALVSEESMIELGRREFTHIEKDKKDKLVMISNPHSVGYFYDKLTQDNPDDRTFILWMDALTAVEEGRFNKTQVLESDNAKHRSTLVRYLLCELDTSDDSMFEEPAVSDEDIDGDYYMGVDAAYKGKDKIFVTLAKVNGRVKVERVFEIEKKTWIDGVTSKDIIDKISQLAGRFAVRRVCVDAGQGIWLIEGLEQNAVPVKGVYFGEGPSKFRVNRGDYASRNAQNMRAEMHLDLQDLMEHKAVIWTEDAASMVRDELSAVKCERKNNGKIQICPKSQVKAQIGHSPDALDSVLLAIHGAFLDSEEQYEYITNG